MEMSMESTTKSWSGSQLTESKLVSMVALGAGALICSLFPVALVKYYTRRSDPLKGEVISRRHFELFLRGGGGVLLATTFLHLMPEVGEDFRELRDEGSFKNWPEVTPELVACIGFFIMYAVEEFAHSLLHNHSKHDGGGHSHVVEGNGPVRGLLIIVALSVHQVFEGLAVGLAPTPRDVWLLLGAVAAHKMVIAVCVGLEIAYARVSLCGAAACVAVFAVASPIGIGIGLGLSAGSDEDPGMVAASVVLQGLAAGTLLYVVFFEVLTKSTHQEGWRGLMELISALIGFVLMYLLITFFHS